MRKGEGRRDNKRANNLRVGLKFCLWIETCQLLQKPYHSTINIGKLVVAGEEVARMNHNLDFNIDFGKL